MLYVPEGFAHGFVTLEPETEVFYEMSSVHQADAARGVRWDDPHFGIDWPRRAEVISDRDASYPDFDLDADPGVPGG
jgi:dTDP-4-dehydrorhamnose 3,5-epimerase